MRRDEKLLDPAGYDRPPDKHMIIFEEQSGLVWCSYTPNLLPSQVKFSRFSTITYFAYIDLQCLVSANLFFNPNSHHLETIHTYYFPELEKTQPVREMLRFIESLTEARKC